MSQAAHWRADKLVVKIVERDYGTQATKRKEKWYHATMVKSTVKRTPFAGLSEHLLQTVINTSHIGVFRCYLLNYCCIIWKTKKVERCTVVGRTNHHLIQFQAVLHCPTPSTSAFGSTVTTYRQL